MNQYKISDILLPQLEQAFPNPSQSLLPSLYMLPQSQLRHQVPRPFLDYMSQAKTNSAKNSLPLELLEEPNKKIRLSHQSCVKVSPKVQNISHSPPSLHKANITRGQFDLTCKDDLTTALPNKLINPLNTSPFGEELVIPGLNILSQNAFQKSSLQGYHRMLQQLEQMKAQYYVQQQILTQLTSQKIPYGNVNHNQMGTQKISPKVGQTMRNDYETCKMESMDSCERQEHPENPNIMSADEVLKGAKTNDLTGMSETSTEEDAEENNYEYIQIEKSNVNLTKKLEAESKPSLKNKAQKTKRNQSEEYWIEYSKLLGNNIYKKAKEEPRHKNKWQAQKGDEDSTIFKQKKISLNTAVENYGETAQNQKLPKLTKPIDTPQHMQDDSKIDYENLISMTITNDPAYVITEGSTAEFVMINKNTNPSIVQPQDTRVGDKYQVSVPEYKGRPVARKSRNLKITWRPEIVKERELKFYFDELCKIFSCEEINQEQALRLLKSKKYRKEGVTENIGKNRKYYAKILMAPEVSMI